MLKKPEEFKEPEAWKGRGAGLRAAVTKGHTGTLKENSIIRFIDAGL